MVRGECSGPPSRLILFEHCLTRFFYFSKHEVSLSFYSLSCLLSTTSNQMGSRDKTIKTQCLYLAWCQVCMPSKYLRQKKIWKDNTYHKYYVKSSLDAFLWTQTMYPWITEISYQQFFKLPSRRMPCPHSLPCLKLLCRPNASAFLLPMSEHVYSKQCHGCLEMYLCMHEMPELWSRIMARHFNILPRFPDLDIIRINQPCSW